MLIGGFCVVGLAFGSQALFYTVVSEIIPRHLRAITQAMLNFTAGVGAVIALLYIVAGLFFVSIVLTTACYNPPPRQLESTLTTRQKIISIDWIGTLFLTSGLTTLALALQWSDNPYKWADADAHLLAPFATSVVLLTAFGLYEWKVKKDGILHHDLFQDRNFVISLISVFAEGTSYFTTNSYYAFEVQALTHQSLFDAGLRYSILFFASGLFSLATGAYTTWTKQLREPLVLGFILLTLFNVLMATIDESMPHTVFWGYPVIGGMGIAILLTNLTVIIQLSTPPSMVSITTGILTAVRSLGATVALAINSAIFSNALSSNVESKMASSILPLGYPQEQLGVLIQALMAGDMIALQSNFWLC
ncbi:major facilitator superfamily domain-containing protein [Aspergillus karnatakaensis]|uniref:major facilitator superfamily domain-containing protein n=1 Tax=Aspergillus karnatakaensis TaxID=1810916 RepID=UPI003CCD13A7